MTWLILILSLPTETATVRQRAWRALKARGAAAVRDGVYALPDRPAGRTAFGQVADDVRTHGGTAWLLEAAEPAEDSFEPLFDRSEDYAALLEEIEALRGKAGPGAAAEGQRDVRRLRREFQQLADIDYFPGEPRSQVEAALQSLERGIARAQAADEPGDAVGAILPRAREDYRRRTWATRSRPWVDRLASAWLIRRHIDPEARFLWLEDASQCPPEALGFDFDGATFTHVAGRVTFEVLAETFGITDAATARLGRLVHHLDMGGVEPLDAAGIESVLAGLRDTFTSDDALVDAAIAVFDALHTHYRRESA